MPKARLRHVRQPSPVLRYRASVHDRCGNGSPPAFYRLPDTWLSIAFTPAEALFG